jgi:Tol biopolymer transport system component
MPDLDDRFRSLRRTRVPDLWPDITTRPPRHEPPFGPPAPLRRVAIALLALAVAAAGIGFGLRAFRRGAGLATTTPTEAPASPGRIVFVAYRHRARRIAVMDSDGSHVRFLTTGREDDVYIRRFGFSADDGPAWSPDGTMIAFVRTYGEGVDSLCEIGPNGTGFRVVIRNLRGAEIAWSPDGSTFAFYSEQDGAIHLIGADGTGERVLTHRAEGVNDDSPAWSPDGRWIAFSSRQIWEIHPDGTGLRKVTHTPGLKASPAWSPDGAKIYYTWFRDAGGRRHASVWEQALSGGTPRLVSPEDGRDWEDPAPTPDGDAILMVASDPRSGTVQLGPLEGPFRRVGDVVPLSTASWRPSG